jgi:hypothetical protein
MDGIKMDLIDMAWGGVDWIGLARDKYKWRALVNTLKKLSSDYATGGLSNSSQLHRVS